MQSVHPNGINPSQPPQLSGQASDMIRGLGGDPEAYEPDATHAQGPVTTTNNSDTGLELSPCVNQHSADDYPAWLSAFLAGEFEVEALADNLAQAIQEDPRFMEHPWWRRVVERLSAFLPEWLIALADAMAQVRHRLDRASKDQSKRKKQ